MFTFLSFKNMQMFQGLPSLACKYDVDVFSGM